MRLFPNEVLPPFCFRWMLSCLLLYAYIYISLKNSFVSKLLQNISVKWTSLINRACQTFDGDFFLIALINYGWINCNKNPRKVGNYVTLQYDTRWLSDGNNVLTRMLKRGGVSKTNREGNVFVEIFCANYRATSPSGNYFVNPGVLGRRKSAPSHSHGEK